MTLWDLLLNKVKHVRETKKDLLAEVMLELRSRHWIGWERMEDQAVWAKTLWWEGASENQLQSEGWEDRKGQTKWKWMARWKQGRKGGPRPCRTSQADWKSQQVTLILKILKSFEYFKQWLITLEKITVTSVWRIDWRRVQSGFGTPSYEAVVQRNPESSLNLSAGGED